MSRIELIIFGATGFTGRRAAEEIVKIGKIKGPFTWGVAGRNKEKLRKLLEEIGKKYEIELKDIPIIVADVNDENSLNEMCKQAQVIVNCCGPYRYYGEAVIKACIKNKCHHVDVSGEMQYMERIQLEYHEKAKENGVYIVSACGVASLPADLGVVFLKNGFKGVVNSVDSFFTASVKSEHKGAALHYGTWESAVQTLSHPGELKQIRKSLFPNELPELKPELKQNWLLHKNRLVNRWCIPFPGTDETVVERSQRYFFENENHRPIQFVSYASFPNLKSALKIAFIGLILELFTKFSIGRKLLLNHPKFFSYGLASHEGPTEESSKNIECSMTLVGKGWSEEPLNGRSTPPNKKLVVKISGVDPAYKATGAALVLCGLAILNEKDKMPDRGGVYPPGAAFAKTNLIQDLTAFEAFKYEVIS